MVTILDQREIRLTVVLAHNNDRPLCVLAAVDAEAHDLDVLFFFVRKQRLELPELVDADATKAAAIENEDHVFSSSITRETNRLAILIG